MKRIKTLILSGAVLMAAVMVGNVSQAADDNGIQTLIMKGGGLTEFHMDEETGVSTGTLKCPIVNLGGGEQGTSTLDFVSQLIFDENQNPIGEEITQANYSYTRDGESVTGNQITVVEFTSFQNEGDTKYLVRCKCEGTVLLGSTWNGVQVTHLSCDCLIEIDTVAGTMTCKACKAQLS